MQLRLVAGLTEAEYVSGRAWERASLGACPLHGKNCGSFSRHGTYVRKTEHGEARIARWYCRKSQVTFSLLPECFASGIPGSLSAMEEAVARLEADPEATAVALQVHPDPRVGAKTARRWLSAAQGAGPHRTGNREGAVCGTTPRLRADRTELSQSLRPGRGPHAVVRMVRRAGTAHAAASRRLHSGLGCAEGGAFLTSEPPTIDGPRSSANSWPEECSNRHSVNMKAGRAPRNRSIRGREQARRDPCGQWLRQHADANIRRQAHVAASSNKNGRT